MFSKKEEVDSLNQLAQSDTINKVYSFLSSFSFRLKKRTKKEEEGVYLFSNSTDFSSSEKQQQQNSAIKSVINSSQRLENFSS